MAVRALAGRLHYALTFDTVELNNGFYRLLSPRSPLNLERFEIFLPALPRGRRHTVEFRDSSWDDERAWTVSGRPGRPLRRDPGALRRQIPNPKFQIPSLTQVPGRA